MTNQRWRVVKANAPTSSGKIWQVWQANQRRKVLHTWHEALDYADRMSRTVEVELPRDYEEKLSHITVERDVDYSLTKWGFEPIISKPWMTITMTQGSIKDTALALLAHHYSNQDN